MNTVIFAEKPSQAREYAEAIGIKKKHKTHIELVDNKYVENGIVTWGFGHLVELKLPKEYDNPVDNWNLSNLPYKPDPIEFKVADDKKSQFNAIKKLFSKADLLVNGCDIDREGSNIFYTTLKVTGIKDKPIKRLWINSLVASEIQKGFLNLKDNQKDLLMFKEASSRAVSDYLIGMNLSPMYSKIFQSKGLREVFSIGRVQTPTLYMIYERYNEIENFKSEKFYEITGNFKVQAGKYKGKAKFKSKSKEEAINLLAKHNLNDMSVEGYISNLSTVEKKQQSPKLHSLSTLQSKINAKYKYSPEKTKKIIQDLYEKKILSYPRTDCNFITENEFEYLKNNLNQYQKLYDMNFEVQYSEPRKRYVDGSRVQEHYAIVPTSKIPNRTTIDNLSDDYKNVLNEVVATTLSMFASDYVYDETNIETNMNDLLFYTKGTVDKILGWKTLYPKSKKENEDKLPAIVSKESVLAKVNLKDSDTKPPNLYTEGQLINLMKTCGKTVDDEDDIKILKDIEGLGTEATRDSIIKSLKDREYISITKNTVYITDKGILLCKAIKDSLLSSPAMTAQWEKRLKEIGNGNASASNFIDITMKFIEKELSTFEEKKNDEELNNLTNNLNESKMICECSNCNKGSITESGKVYKCTNCNQVYFKKFFNNPIPKKELLYLIKNGKTKNKINLKKKDGKTYKAYLILDNNKEKNIKQYKISFN